MFGISGLEDITLEDLTDLLLFHAVADEVIHFDELECEHPDNALHMANGESSFT